MKQQMRRGDPRRQRYWEEVVQRWRQSGRRVRDYCRAEGLGESTFHYWRKRLELHHQSSETVGRRPLRQRSLADHDQPTFLPVRVTEPTSVSSAPAEASGTVEIVLERGCKVRVSAGFDRQALADVLAMLEAQPC